jgi:hypothetical protein
MMELGAMWSAHCDRAIALTPTERRRLRTLGAADSGYYTLKRNSTTSPSRIT